MKMSFIKQFCDQTLPSFKSITFKSALRWALFVNWANYRIRFDFLICGLFTNNTLINGQTLRVFGWSQKWKKIGAKLNYTLGTTDKLFSRNSILLCTLMRLKVNSMYLCERNAYYLIPVTATCTSTKEISRFLYKLF